MDTQFPQHRLWVILCHFQGVCHTLVSNQVVVVVQSYIWVLCANPLVCSGSSGRKAQVAASVYTMGPLCQSTDLGVGYHSVWIRGLRPGM